MNKISKKIVSLVTMAAFALTLVPAAAFAAEGTDSTVVVRSEDATIVEGGEASINVTVGSLDENEKIVLWVQKGNAIYDKATYEVSGANEVTTSAHEWDNTVIIEGTSAGTVATVDVTIPDDGLYTVCAGVSTDNKAANLEALDPINITKDNTITVVNAADRSKSLYGVIKDNKVQDTASVNINKDLTTSFMINDGGSKATIAPLANVVIWAIDSKTGDPSSCLVVDGATKVAGNYAYSLGDVTNLQDVDIQFTTGGEYTIYAGVGATYDAAKDNKLVGATKVKVTDTTEIDSLTLKDEAGNALPYDKESNTFTLDLTKDAVKGDFVFGGSDVYTINGTAFDGKDEALNQELTFSTKNTDIVEFVDADKTVNTGNTGTFKLEFSMQDKKNAVITITDSKTGDEYNVRIIATKTTAKDIDRSAEKGTRRRAIMIKKPITIRISNGLEARPVAM